jgi:hypothetical protein
MALAECSTHRRWVLALQVYPPRSGALDVFSYDVLPVNRQRALDFIRREVEASRGNGLNARLLVPLTRGHGDGAALQFEVELQQLDQLDQFRNRGIGSSQETGNWMHAFSEVLTAPPGVEILHVDSVEA